MGYDYYALLDISRGASDYEIKMAFRRQAIKYNPERNHNETLQPLFVLICEAYEVLSNKFRKAIFDQYGEQGLKRGVMTTLGYVPPYQYDRDTKRTYREFFGTDSPFADLLTAHTPQKNQNSLDIDKIFDKQVEKDVQNESLLETRDVIISMEELYTGCLKLLSVPVKEYDRCSEKITIINTFRTLHLKIKPGLPERSVFRFSPGPDEYFDSGAVRDTLVITKDKPHPTFWREGADLHMNKKTSFQEALTGFSFTVDTLDGRILHIPITDLITCNQSMKVIKGEGMPRVDIPHRRGDLFIHLSVEYPRSLPQKIRKTLLSLLDNSETEKNVAHSILNRKSI